MPRKQNFELNDKEKAVYAAFSVPASGQSAGASASIEDLAAKAFKARKKGSAPGSKGNSWTRNSLRKLVRLGLVKMGGGRSGSYCRTSLKLADLKAKSEEARA
jgi:hypothetical protein